MFPPNFMSTIYFFFGLAQAITDYIASVSARQEAFTVNRADYPHIGEHPDRLVVFFSRMGYVRKQAYEEAERTGTAGMDALLGITHTGLRTIRCRTGIRHEITPKKSTPPRAGDIPENDNVSLKTGNEP